MFSEIQQVYYKEFIFLSHLKITCWHDTLTSKYFNVHFLQRLSLHNYNITIKFKTLTLVHYYHLLLRPHSSFIVVPILSFLTKESSPEACVGVHGHVSLVSFNLECSLSLSQTFMILKGRSSQDVSQGGFVSCFLAVRSRYGCWARKLLSLYTFKFYVWRPMN